jgi:hypothetical protein
MAPAAHLIDLGAMLATSYDLEDGSRVRLRLARPTDVPLVQEFLAGGSADVLVEDELVRRFTYYDPREHIVLAATRLDGGRERIVALGDAAFDDLPEVVVGDGMEDSRLADLMADAVAHYTRLEPTWRRGRAA